MKTTQVYILKGDTYYDPFMDGTELELNRCCDSNRVDYVELPIRKDGMVKYQGKALRVYRVAYGCGINSVDAIFPDSKN